MIRRELGLDIMGHKKSVSGLGIVSIYHQPIVGN